MPAETHFSREQRLAECLGFFASVIKSGEPWTETCQQAYDAARAPSTPESSKSDREIASRLLIELCSDDKGISIPIRRTIEEAEALIVEALHRASTHSVASIVDEAGNTGWIIP